MIFAALAKNTKTNKLEIVAIGLNKSAASRKANKNTRDPWCKRLPHYPEIHLCEFESSTDAREYVARVNKH